MKTVTFRSPEEQISRLDAIAELQQRDRSFLINEALQPRKPGSLECSCGELVRSGR